MAHVTMRDLLEAGVHFGHRTRFWNPQMAPYIYGVRDSIHIIHLERTLPLLREALHFISQTAATGRDILFVGTKKAAQQAVAEAAQGCDQPYVHKRWLGGMLTNYQTIKKSLSRLDELDALFETGRIQAFGKKERLSLDRERSNIVKNIGGIRHAKGLPGALFVIDVGYEHIAVLEARKLGIPVIGIVDTNNKPDDVDMIIPGNDDSSAAIRLYVNAVRDTVREARIAANIDSPEQSKGTKKSVARAKAARKQQSSTETQSAPTNTPDTIDVPTTAEPESTDSAAVQTETAAQDKSGEAVKGENT